MEILIETIIACLSAIILFFVFDFFQKEKDKADKKKREKNKILNEQNYRIYKEQQEQKDREYNRFINEMRDRCIKEFGENYGEVKFAEFMMKMREIELLEGNKQAQLNASRMLGMMVMQNSIHNMEHTIHHH